jgi:hypothetical protein
MEIAGLILLVLGSLMIVACKIWFFAIAFSVSPAWGLACFIPFVSICFIATHWDETRPSLFAALPSTLVVVLGALLLGGA